MEYININDKDSYNKWTNIVVQYYKDRIDENVIRHMVRDAIVELATNEQSTIKISHFITIVNNKVKNYYTKKYHTVKGQGENNTELWNDIDNYQELSQKTNFDNKLELEIFFDYFIKRFPKYKDYSYNKLLDMFQHTTYTPLKYWKEETKAYSKREMQRRRNAYEARRNNEKYR